MATMGVLFLKKVVLLLFYKAETPAPPERDFSFHFLLSAMEAVCTSTWHVYGN